MEEFFNTYLRGMNGAEFFLTLAILVALLYSVWSLTISFISHVIQKREEKKDRARRVHYIWRRN